MVDLAGLQDGSMFLFAAFTLSNCYLPLRSKRGVNYCMSFSYHLQHWNMRQHSLRASSCPHFWTTGSEDSNPIDLRKKEEEERNKKQHTHTQVAYQWNWYGSHKNRRSSRPRKWLRAIVLLATLDHYDLQYLMIEDPEAMAWSFVCLTEREPARKSQKERERERNNEREREKKEQIRIRRSFWHRVLKMGG